MSKQPTDRAPVLITTKHRGVFFGYEVGRYDQADGNLAVLLEGARCAIRFGTTGGFMQLAATGPTEASRVGDRADGEFRDVTCVLKVTPDAVEAWERA